MVEEISDMPNGTLGFHISGRMTRRDYVQALVPPLHERVEAGQRLRVLYLIGSGLRMEPGAVWEDLKLEAELGIRHREAWERIAVVTDLEWIWRAFELFSWMVPGEMRLFHEPELEQARTWLAAGSA